MKIITLAPERPGALAATLELRSRGIVVSMGHSSANVSDADNGVDRYETNLVAESSILQPWRRE